MKFGRLKFYDVGFGRSEAVVMFPNNHGALVSQTFETVGAEELPSVRQQHDDTYEVAVLVATRPRARGKKGEDVEITYETPITDDVLHDLRRETVERVLDEIAALPRRSLDEPKPKSISVFYEVMSWPEDEEGERAEQPETEGGHERNVPIVLDEYDREEGVTYVDRAAELLRDEGAIEPSSFPFSPGTWYTTEWDSDWSTGDEEQNSFHLNGFTEEEEREIYDRVVNRRR